MKGLKEISEQMQEGITQFIEAADGSKSIVDKAILDMKKRLAAAKDLVATAIAEEQTASTRLSRRYGYRGNMGVKRQTLLCRQITTHAQTKRSNRSNNICALRTTTNARLIRKRQLLCVSRLHFTNFITSSKTR